LILREQPLGEAISLGFDQDDDIAVFVPASADVFHCPKQDWRILVGAAGSVPMEGASAPEINAQGVAGLKAALMKSGINFS